MRPSIVARNQVPVFSTRSGAAPLSPKFGHVFIEVETFKLPFYSSCSFASSNKQTSPVRRLFSTTSFILPDTALSPLTHHPELYNRVPFIVLPIAPPPAFSRLNIFLIEVMDCLLPCPQSDEPCSSPHERHASEFL